MKKACIFDLDGTLLNTIKTIEYYGNLALEKNGFPAIEQKEYNYFVGNGAELLVRRMLKFHGCEDEEIFKKVFRDYNEAYDADVLFKTDVYDGVRETLDGLKQKGVKIAVLSNKPNFATQSVVEIFFGKGYFDVVFGQREGVAIKPSPDAVFEILDILNVEKEDCLYVGDTAVDMQTGASAGLYTIGVLWGFRERKELQEAKANTIIDNPKDILNIAEA